MNYDSLIENGHSHESAMDMLAGHAEFLMEMFREEKHSVHTIELCRLGIVFHRLNAVYPEYRYYAINEKRVRILTRIKHRNPGMVMIQDDMISDELVYVLVDELNKIYLRHNEDYTFRPAKRKVAEWLGLTEEAVQFAYFRIENG